MKTVEEISAGGVVVFGNAILLLKKYNGEWVLPKGKVNKNENIIDGALREVFEESGSRAGIIKYLDMISYEFVRESIKDVKIKKTVHWYLMKAKNMKCRPLKKEGFSEAKFIHFEKSLQMIRYSDEKRIIEKAITVLDFII